MIDWKPVRLVVFDVDGTLYDQRRLRLGMAVKLLRHCLTTGDFETPRVVATYRRLREEIAEQELNDFEPVLVRMVATKHRWSEARVRATISDWIDTRPLPLLRACRFDGVAELFQDLRTSGREIGVLSDYPAREKLAKLGLAADYVLAAGDDAVRVLKPNPRGLLHLMALAGAQPRETVMIGDRAERDGEMGVRAGVKTYLRSAKKTEGWPCFRSFGEIALQAG